MTTKATPNDVRAWSASNGFSVGGTRGRLPGDSIIAYNKANPAKPYPKVPKTTVSSRAAAKAAKPAVKATRAPKKISLAPKGKAGARKTYTASEAAQIFAERNMTNTCFCTGTVKGGDPCGQIFTGVTAFDRHQVAELDKAGYTCADPAAVELVRNDEGFWRVNT